MSKIWLAKIEEQTKKIEILNNLRDEVPISAYPYLKYISARIDKERDIRNAIIPAYLRCMENWTGRVYTAVSVEKGELI